jgi:5-methylcytosine-specific restriction endonuclease McrA
LDKKREQAIIKSVALAIESEQDAYDLIEMLGKEDWGKWIRDTKSSARMKDLPCVLCKKIYRCGDGPCTGFCHDCYYTKDGMFVVSKLSINRSRARKAGLPYTLTLREWYSTLDDFSRLCAYCSEASYVDIEHFIPIVLGGGTTKNNCIPACTSCNHKKKNRLPQDVASRYPKGAIDRISLYLSRV